MAFQGLTVPTKETTVPSPLSPSEQNKEKQSKAKTNSLENKNESSM